MVAVPHLHLAGGGGSVLKTQLPCDWECLAGGYFRLLAVTWPVEVAVSWKPHCHAVGESARAAEGAAMATATAPARAAAA